MKNKEWIGTLPADEGARAIEKFMSCDSCNRVYSVEYQKSLPYSHEDPCDRQCLKWYAEWLDKEHEEELTSCPFCGGEASFVDGGLHLKHDSDCYLSIIGRALKSTPTAVTAMELRNAWERRHFSLIKA